MKEGHHFLPCICPPVLDEIKVELGMHDRIFKLPNQAA
jgi:hypothetical protein